ncbi:MFS transporter [Chromobacterium subtsugae]|uniref:MFS transporter n=1 Tax=Chromobacterium subtsugae TaxID=251747 RepID=UPI00064122DD|nr:MFS transporter [Chromobacterium subtsugae]
MPLAIYVLGLSIFAMTTSEFMVAGMMPSLAAQFGVSLTAIGYLVSAFAASIVVGGPILTVMLLKASKKNTLLTLVALFFVSQLIGATAHSYEVMLASRVLSGVAESAFFGVSLAVCVDIVGPQRIGRASSIVLGGLMVASVVGLPAATLIDQHLGWRASFWIVAGMMLFCGLVIAVQVPKSPKAAEISLKQEFAAFRNADLWAAYGTSGLIIGATFAAFTYFAPIFTEVSGFSTATVPALFACYGLATIVGTMITGRLADKHTMGVLAVGLVILISLLALFALKAESQAVTIVAVALLGLVGLPMNPAMAIRVMRVANNGPLVNTVHTAVINVGIVVGSWAGGSVMSAGHDLRAPLWVGVALAIAGLVSVLPFLRRHSAEGVRARLAGATR